MIEIQPHAKTSFNIILKWVISLLLLITVFSITLMQNFLLALIWLVPAIVISLLTLKKHVFHINKVNISRQTIRLTASKFGKPQKEELYELDSIQIEIKEHIRSIRGIEYKLFINTRDRIIFQYEANGWNHELFKDIITAIEESKKI